MTENQGSDIRDLIVYLVAKEMQTAIANEQRFAALLAQQAQDIKRQTDQFAEKLRAARPNTTDDCLDA